MPLTVHPSYANHKHLYDFQEEVGTFTALANVNVKNCPSGHTYCIPDGTPTSSTLKVVEAVYGRFIEGWWAYYNALTGYPQWLTDAECLTAGLDLDNYSYAKGAHIHPYWIWGGDEPLGDPLGVGVLFKYGGDCGAGHSDCRMYRRDCALSSMTAVWWDYARAAAWVDERGYDVGYMVANANVKHRHFYTFVNDNYVEHDPKYFITALKTCPLGHTNCQIDSSEQKNLLAWYGWNKTSFASPSPPSVAGYIWVEGTDLMYTVDAGIEVPITGTVVGAVGTAYSGHIWVEGNYLHYIDQSGDERRKEGTLDGATGQTAGRIWVESVKLRYIDASGNERYLWE